MAVGHVTLSPPPPTHTHTARDDLLVLSPFVF